jgi:hypothetical protein
MKHLALFESWQSDFLGRYEKATRLFQLGIIDSPLAFDSPLWEEFKQLVEDRLTAEGYQIEEFSLHADSTSRVVLEISKTKPHQYPLATDTLYLRYMFMQDIAQPGNLYLISANYMGSFPVSDPERIIDTISELADQNLKQKLDSSN